MKLGRSNQRRTNDNQGQRRQKIQSCRLTSGKEAEGDGCWQMRRDDSAEHFHKHCRGATGEQCVLCYTERLTVVGDNTLLSSSDGKDSTLRQRVGKNTKTDEITNKARPSQVKAHTPQTG